MLLHFEAAWDRAIAPQDRHTIEQLFTDFTEKEGHAIIRTAINHKNQLLVSVLIFNRQSEDIHFENTLVEFQQVKQYFTTDAIVIPPYTAMPWTFIFDATEGYDLHNIAYDDLIIHI